MYGAYKRCLNSVTMDVLCTFISRRCCSCFRRLVQNSSIQLKYVDAPQRKAGWLKQTSPDYGIAVVLGVIVPAQH